MFTVEEMSLIQAMDPTCRRMLICHLRTSLPNIEDRELQELCEKTLKKVENLSDTDFAAIDFTVEEDEEHA